MCEIGPHLIICDRWSINSRQQGWPVAEMNRTTLAAYSECHAEAQAGGATTARATKGATKTHKESDLGNTGRDDARD